MRLRDKVAIVSGGAAGMGAAEARLLSSEGASVVIADVLRDEGEAIEREINGAGGVAAFMPLDVTRPEDWARVVTATIDRFGKIDILVNNAGITGSGADDVMEIGLFDRLIGVNLRGTFLGLREVVPHMTGRGGSIINIASICANIGTPGTHLGYNASKGGISAITKAAAAQFGPDGIRVNSVHPGVVPPMRSKLSLEEIGARVGNRILARVPLGREGTREEVAHAVLFLASDESSYMTGTEIHVDGGLLAT